MKAQAVINDNPFLSTRENFEQLVEKLQSQDILTLAHGEVEDLINVEGREILRQLFQSHLMLRAELEVKHKAIKGADNILRTHRRQHDRQLETLFGTVVVERIGYGKPGSRSLNPLDAELNLPEDKYSHGAQRRVSEEITKNSFDEVVVTMKTTTGANVPKRQTQEIASHVAQDFDAFYKNREKIALEEAKDTGSILVLSADGKGVVMRNEDLREATRKAAQKRVHKLDKRLSKGEKRNAKRMAEVASVYTVKPFVRKPEDIVNELNSVKVVKDKQQRPRPESKRVWASLEKDMDEVIDDAFQEGQRRDPEQCKNWVALVDGNKTQLKLLKKLAKNYCIQLVVILDLIHVIEYLWKAAHVFHKESSKEAEKWVTKRILGILQGRAGYIAAGIRRSATLRKLSAKARKPVDKCVDYLLNNREYLKYDEYLAHGFPIATGVIEGACRHLVKDRMDITGARWGLKCAEAVLKLRSIRSSGDFEEYWHFHQEREMYRNHKVLYENELPPSTQYGILKVVK